MSIKGFATNKKRKPHPIHSKKGISETDLNLKGKERKDKIEVKTKSQPESMIGKKEEKESEFNSKIDFIEDVDSRSFMKLKNINAEPEIDGKKIRLNFYIIAENMYDATGEREFEKKPILYRLVMVPSKKDLGKQFRKQIEEELSNNVGTSEDMLAMSMVDHGYLIESGIDELGTWNDEKRIAIEFSKKAEPIASLIGFYLDKPWNQIGTTGWDSLREFTMDDESAIQQTLRRYE